MIKIVNKSLNFNETKPCFNRMTYLNYMTNKLYARKNVRGNIYTI